MEVLHQDPLTNNIWCPSPCLHIKFYWHKTIKKQPFFAFWLFKHLKANSLLCMLTWGNKNRFLLRWPCSGRGPWCDWRLRIPAATITWSSSPGGPGNSLPSRLESWKLGQENRRNPTHKQATRNWFGGNLGVSSASTVSETLGKIWYGYCTNSHDESDILRYHIQ